MENQNWEKEFNALFTEYSHEPTLIRVRHFIRTLLTTHSNALRAELAGKLKNLLTDDHPFCYDGCPEDDSECPLNLRNQTVEEVLAIIQPDTTA